MSEAGDDVGEEPTAPESPIRVRPRGSQDAFARLDDVELKRVFSWRARLLMTIPFILKGMPKARTILPFVRFSYASSSAKSWWDENEEMHTVNQAEGGEQGDPPMLLLFSIRIQGALEEVAGTLEAGEQLCAFLDDIYVLCQSHCELARCLLRVARIHFLRRNTCVEKGRCSTR